MVTSVFTSSATNQKNRLLYRSNSSPNQVLLYEFQLGQFMKTKSNRHRLNGRIGCSDGVDSVSFKSFHSSLHKERESDESLFSLNSSDSTYIHAYWCWDDYLSSGTSQSVNYPSSLEPPINQVFIILSPTFDKSYLASNKKQANNCLYD